MKCSSVLAQGQSLESALTSCHEVIQSDLGQSPDFMVAFVSGKLVDELQESPNQIYERFQPKNLLGCTADSLIGTRSEIENESALSIWAGVWPGAELVPFHLEIVRSADGISIDGWPDASEPAAQSAEFGVIFADPFSFAADVLLDRMAEDRPELAIVGGLASRGYSPGNNRLLLNETLISQGAVGVLVKGGVAMTPVLSQGCRPIGTSFVVTKAERNEVVELGGRPALECLKKLFDELPVREQVQVQQGLLVGRVIDEYQETFEMGDFLIRGVVGIDEDRKTISVGDYFRPGQTIQFHIRDQESADIEFRQLLQRAKLPRPPVGGLLFSCNGRGTHLFESANHDADCIANEFGDLPLAGFFAAGEIGPVGGRSFTHGFTASVALFSPTS